MVDVIGLLKVMKFLLAICQEKLAPTEPKRNVYVPTTKGIRHTPILAKYR